MSSTFETITFIALITMEGLFCLLDFEFGKKLISASVESTTRFTDTFNQGLLLLMRRCLVLFNAHCMWIPAVLHKA